MIIPLGKAGVSHSRSTDVAVIFTTLGGPWPIGAAERVGGGRLKDEGGERE